ncbi:MAG: hypothetical protein JOZ24_03995 [Candidatus Eremiobacteraeota bacterium]|nr:hypothetical protein [Candidatus Eremiobacteraeota bacterium]
MPIMPKYYPNGLEGKPTYGHNETKPLPPSIPCVVTGASHLRHVVLTADSLLWYVHRGAVGFDSWTPSLLDPESVGFARIILAPRGGATQEQLTLAMLAVRTALAEHGVETIPLLDGYVGAALYIPFSDVPAYMPVRAWLHRIADTAVARNATLLTADPHDQKSRRIHVNVSTNAVNRGSSLPYVLTGSKHLGMVTPIAWSELGVVANGAYTADNSAERFAQGDLFARLAAEIGAQSFARAVR